jgi:peptidoglycan hydrolase-like protein with peptidoglycan-binding domain
LGTTASPDAKADIKGLQIILNNAGAGLEVDGIVGEKTLAAVKKYSIELNDRGNLIKWVQERLTQLGFDAGYADGFAEKPTMDAIYSWQKANGLGVGNLYGSDWDVLLA